MNLKSGAPATMSTSLFQNPRLGLTSCSELKLRSHVSLRPPSRDISQASGATTSCLTCGGAAHSGTSDNASADATMAAQRENCGRVKRS